MDSVIFEDASALKEFKKAKRREMLALMAANPDWRKSDGPVAREILRLGKVIDGETMDVSRPIKSIDIKKLTVKEYVFLIKLGYQDRYLRKVAGLSKNKWIELKEKLVEEHEKRRQTNARNLPHNDHSSRS